MNILVTGATGFVGGYIVPALIELGFNVKCLVRTEEKGRKLKQKYNVEIVIGDITEPRTLQGISDDIDYVIHMAAMGHVSAVTEEAYMLFTGINEGGTQNLINEFSNSSRLKKFVHFSSTAAMGPIGIPVLDERSVPNPITPYQKSKNRSEIIVQKACKEKRLPGVVIRPCMIYGIGGYGEFYKFCKLMKKGIFPKVGMGKNLTPLVHVKDVCNAAILAMKDGRVGETYIIASDNSIPMDRMRELIVNSIGARSMYLYIPCWIALLGVKVLERVFTMLGKEPIATYNNIKSTITDRTFDISKAKHELGYEVQVSFEEGIKETIEWYKQQGKI